jgi:membrane AbrB-like protein
MPALMATPVSAFSVPLRTAETLLIAAFGGILFTLIGFPAGLIAGSVVAVAAAALIGRPMVVPPALMRVTFVLIGIALGAVVTPETLKGLAAWPISIAVLAVAIGCMIAATTCYLRWAHGWDTLSALFGASPGSLAQTMSLAVEYGTDVRAVAVVQTMRVLLLTLGFPAGLALFGLVAEGPLAFPASPHAFSLSELIVLVAVSTLAALGLLWIRFPGGLLFGAMLASGLLHGGGFMHAVLPSWVTTAAIVAVGAVTGARFANTSPRMFLSYIGAAIGSFAVAVTIASCFMLIAASLMSVRVADVVVAFAPGAQDTMMVLALALHLDPVYVGAHQLARFMIVSLSIPLIAKRIAPKPLPGKTPPPPAPDEGFGK